MASIWDEVTSLDHLRAGLERATRNRGGAGADGQSVQAFASDGTAALASLRAELLAGDYRPRAPRRLALVRPDGDQRPIDVVAVRDRVLQHTLARALASRVDALLSDAAHAYRPGRSPRTALVRVDELLRGKGWVFRGDIARFFETVPRAKMVARLLTLVDEPEVIALIEAMFEAGVFDGRVITPPGEGLPQGSPLSPVLSNIYLLPFDLALSRAGLAAVRYGDDFCVVAGSQDEALLAETVATSSLRRLGLALNTDKAAVRSVAEGFDFLGFSFSPAGRAPAPASREKLARKVRDLVERRPDDAHEELVQLLRGWLLHYGSLEGVTLPPGAEKAAEQVEGEVSERAVRARHARAKTLGRRGGLGLWSTLRAALLEAGDAAPGSPPEDSPLGARLAAAGIGGERRDAMIDALRAGDGGLLSELLAREGLLAQSAAALELSRDRERQGSPGREAASRQAEAHATTRPGPHPPTPPPERPNPMGRALPTVDTTVSGDRALVASPFAAWPRAQAVVEGCSMLRGLIDRAMSGQGLERSQRYVVADILGRLGDDAEPALTAVFRHLTDHQPGMARQAILKLYASPTSCARIRDRHGELAAKVGCSCTFRPPPGAYPTPLLHALGAVEVPGLEDRVRTAKQPRNAVARAALSAVNAGRKEFADKAAILCARMADLRRQIALQQGALAELEHKLSLLCEEAGDEPLETPAGRLRRVVEEGGRVRFVLEV